jgi:glycerol-3-phosphate acyltransferase PlsX
MPKPDGGVCMFLDCGANADCKPINLVHFAIMADVYMKNVAGVKNPRIGLLSNGAEDQKGNELIKTVNGALRSLKSINFIGNIEGRDILSGVCDIVVTDGFSGNIALKSVEGTCHLVMKLIKQSIKESFFAKFGLPFMIGAMRKMKKTMDPRLYNGAMFVGLNGLSVKSHGGTDAFGFSVAVENAARLVRKDFVASIRKELENIDLEELSQEACYEVY